MAIQLSERAAEEIKTILGQHDLSPETTYLRLSVKSGGCSGLTYGLDLTDARGEHDEGFDSYGIKLICDSKSYLYLNGTTVQFKEGITERGFVFNNPNATGFCTCGASFSA